MKRLFVGLALVLAFVVVVSAWGNADKIKLQDVRVLTLKRGEYTSGRRSSPVPQLSCVGGPAKHHSNSIQAVQCQNMGSDDRNNVQWKCEGDLESTVRFGKIEVSCEGYDYPDDPYILRGSCGLEYTLEYTSEGQHKQQYQQYQQQQQHQQYQQQQYQQPHSNYHYSHQEHGSGFRLKTLLMLCVVLFIFYNIYKQCTQIGSGGSGHRSWGTGGPGSGPYPPGGYGPGSDPYYGSGCAPTPTYQQSWRPGFWTGLATGGFMGRMWNRPHHYGPSYHTATYSAPSYSAPSYSSGPSFSSGSSSTTRTASGFGGTRRR